LTLSRHPARATARRLASGLLYLSHPTLAARVTVEASPVPFGLSDTISDFMPDDRGKNV
jgi:hypothetical protein